MEQLFSTFKKDLYFLNNMTPVVHLFIFRLLCHLKNENINSNLRTYHEKEFGNSLGENYLGQLCEQSLLYPSLAGSFVIEGSGEEIAVICERVSSSLPEAAPSTVELGTSPEPP